MDRASHLSVYIIHTNNVTLTSNMITSPILRWHGHLYLVQSFPLGCYLFQCHVHWDKYEYIWVVVFATLTDIYGDLSYMISIWIQRTSRIAVNYTIVKFYFTSLVIWHNIYKFYLCQHMYSYSFVCSIQCIFNIKKEDTLRS